MSEMSEMSMSGMSMSEIMPMPFLGRQVADIPAYVSYHGLDDYISFTKPNKTYDELYADPIIEKAEHAHLHLEHSQLEHLENKPFDAYKTYTRSIEPLQSDEVPRMERQMGQPESYVFEFGVEAYKKYKNDPRTIEEILENKDIKEANDHFMNK